MAEALAVHGLAKPVLERAGNSIINHVSYSLFVVGRVEALKIQIDKLKQKRRDVEDMIKYDEPAGKVPTEEIKGWLTSAEKLVHEADSIINEYDNRSCILCRSTLSINLWSNHYISVQSMELKTKVEGELTSFKDIQITKQPPPTVGQLVSTDTLGAETGSEIQSKVEEVLDFLRDGTKGMLGIWGMGGVGKTTVLKQVNNELAKDSSLKFHRVILVTASRECTVEKLQYLIVKALNLRGDGDHKNNIFNFLSDKSFVILLDDLWERLDLDQVGVPRLCVLGELKHKLILTTRSLEVCIAMNVRLTVKVDCLDRKKARQLFREKVGDEIINSHPLISKLADDVADECGGLPKALITVAGAMAGSCDVKEWMKALKYLRESKHSMISGIIDDPLPLLRISYDYLRDPSIQECLLLCALWPEDWEIDIEDLIQCWMGHDLLGKFDTVGEAYENGRRIIDKLVKSSLLEKKIEGRVTTVSLHDLIRDMALWIARDNEANERKWVVFSSSVEAFKDQKSWKDAHKVSLMYNGVETLPSNIQNAQHSLNTLMLRSNYLRCKEVEVVQNFHELKYLELSQNYELRDFPLEICKLNKLEYLDLSYTKISRLPMKLEELARLKYLLLRGTKISEVSNQLFSSLTSLEVLDVSTGLLISQSLIIENLDCLKGRLKGLGINACSEEDLDKLALLSLPIRTLHRHVNKEEKTPLHLLPSPNKPGDCTWSDLEYLKVSGLFEELVIDEHHPPNRLFLYDINNLKEIIWKRVDQNDVIHRLYEVRIVSCQGLKHLSWLVNLPLLETLCVGDCISLKHIVWNEVEEADNIMPPVTLHSLRVLTLETLFALKTISNCTLHLPSLEILRVYDCKRLKKLPFDTPASCNKLKKFRCYKGWFENILELDDYMRTHLGMFSSYFY